MGACGGEDSGGASPDPGRPGFLNLSEIRSQIPFPDPIPDTIPDPEQRPRWARWTRRGGDLEENGHFP